MENQPGKIRTIFFGTPDFAVPCLRALLEDENFEIVGVITQPDKKAGRKQILTPPPVKVEAAKYGLTVWQPESIKDYQLPVSDVDLIVVVAYAKIVPELMLNYPKYGCVNVHGSLLPKYRGAACVQAAIANGDKETGITIMKMGKGLDTGPIILKERLVIDDDDTGGSLFDKLADLGASVLTSTLKKYISGEIEPEDQDDSNSSYVGMLKKEDGKIKWYEDAVTLERFVRSRQPWPGAWTMIKNDGEKTIKILEVSHHTLPNNEKNLGEAFLSGHKLAVQCGKGALIIKKLQMEGKTAVSSEEFLRGHKDFIGKELD